MRLMLHRVIPEDQNFREQWNELAHAIEQPQVFYTYEWALAVSRAYASSLEPLLFAAYREGTMAGVVALASDSVRSQVSFLTASTADYCDFISAPADREEFVRLVMKELRAMGVVEFRLANLPADSVSARVLKSAFRRSGYSLFARPAYLCAQVTTNSSPDQLRISESVGRRLKRMSTAMRARGEITVNHRTTWDDFVPEFSRFATAHVGRFLAMDRLSNLVRHERRTFLAELAGLLSARGWLSLSTLRVGDKTIAWNYGFKFAGSWFWYQPAFDTELHHLSPGSYLLCEILRQAGEDPEIHTVDMGLGGEGYKQRYAKAGRQTLHITATLSKRRRAWERSRHHAAELVKKSPRFERRIRDRLSQIAALRRRAAEKGLARCCRYYFSRYLHVLFGDTEMLFFECTAPQSHQPDVQFSLQPISIGLLAAAAMAYENQDDTLRYLLRSASRLQSGGGDGFALVAASGVPVHFCWVAPFEDFRMAELKQVLQEPAADSVLLFDCWTPLPQRGSGLYRHCISQVASRMLTSGKHPWIFSAATNPSSVRGIERAGFVPRFSLVRKKRLLLDRISKLEFKGSGGPVLDLYPAA
jgi:CelD/BcsL family acetyltransferase involved in cellulose biosynthesis